jgi:D-alanyl-D-alanine dipeptidase
VDLTLFDRSSGDPVPMPSDFDEMTERSHLDYGGGSEQGRANRQRLHEAMTSGGFNDFAPEWWHYDYHEWDRYPVLDLSFTDILASLNHR